MPRARCPKCGRLTGPKPHVCGFVNFTRYPKCPKCGRQIGKKPHECATVGLVEYNQRGKELTERLQVMVSKEDIQQVDQLAEDWQTTRSEVVRTLIRETREE